jgi:hypothetical protein
LFETAAVCRLTLRGMAAKSGSKESQLLPLS